MDTRRKKKVVVIALMLGFTLLLTVTGWIIDATKADAADHACGTITCTVYFNRAETEVIANGDVAVGTIAAACAVAGTPLAGVACGAAGTIIVIGAQWAKANGNCMKLKYGYVWNEGFRFYPMQYACGTRPWVQTSRFLIPFVWKAQPNTEGWNKPPDGYNPNQVIEP